MGPQAPTRVTYTICGKISFVHKGEMSKYPIINLELILLPFLVKTKKLNSVLREIGRFKSQNDN